MAIFAVIELLVWFLIARYTFKFVRWYKNHETQTEQPRESDEDEVDFTSGSLGELRKRNMNVETCRPVGTELAPALPDSSSQSDGTANNRILFVACFVFGYLFLVMFDTLLVRMVAHQVVYTPQKCTLNTVNLGECSMNMSVPFEHVYFTAKENSPQLHGIWVPSTSTSETQKTLNILLNSGSDGHVGFRYYPALYQWLAQQGVNVLAWDYPGYGLSEGVPSEEQIYQGAEAAFKWLMRKTNARPREIVVHGFSLGGPVAVYLASKYDVKAVILQACMDRIGHVANGEAPIGGWLLPYTLPEQLDAVDNMKNIRSCLFFFVATNDETFPEKRELVLYNNAVNVPKHCKKYYRLLGFGHLDNPLTDPKFVVALKEFLDSMRE